MTAAIPWILHEIAAKIAAPGHHEPQRAPGDKEAPTQSADGSKSVSPYVVGHHVGLDYITFSWKVVDGKEKAVRMVI